MSINSPDPEMITSTHPAPVSSIDRQLESWMKVVQKGFEDWAKTYFARFPASEDTRLAYTAAKAAWETAYPKWEPVETVPKDNPIVVLTEYGDLISVIWRADRFGEGQWCDWKREPLIQAVTHWMPLAPMCKES